MSIDDDATALVPMPQNLIRGGREVGGFPFSLAGWI